MTPDPLTVLTVEEPRAVQFLRLAATDGGCLMDGGYAKDICDHIDCLATRLHAAEGLAGAATNYLLVLAAREEDESNHASSGMRYGLSDLADVRTKLQAALAAFEAGA